MQKESDVLLNLLHKKKYKAYYIGNKCLVDLHNNVHQNKLNSDITNIITNAKYDQLKNIFPYSKDYKDYIQVFFGGYKFNIISTSNFKQYKNSGDFTIDNIMQKINGDYVDYTFQYRNRKISAIKDVNNKTVRFINNNRHHIIKNPKMILKAFNYESNLGYNIESQTLNAIKRNLDLLNEVSFEDINKEINEIILGKFAAKSLSSMKDAGIFDLILLELKDIKDFSILDKLNNSDREDNVTNIEAWTVLLKCFGYEKARNVLINNELLNNSDIDKVEWLIRYYNIIDSDNLFKSIHEARNKTVKDNGLMYMKDLILRLNTIHNRVNEDCYLYKSEKLMQAFCSRPYFHNQIKISDEEFIKIANIEEGPWLYEAKENLIKELVNMDKYPKNKDIYDSIVLSAINKSIN